MASDQVIQPLSTEHKGCRRRTAGCPVSDPTVPTAECGPPLAVSKVEDLAVDQLETRDLLESLTHCDANPVIGMQLMSSHSLFAGAR